MQSCQGGGGGGARGSLSPPLAEGRGPDSLTFLIKTYALSSQNSSELVELLYKEYGKARHLFSFGPVLAVSSE